MRVREVVNSATALGVLAIIAIGGGAVLLAQFGRDAVLQAQAEAASRQWIAYLQHHVPDLADIAKGGQPSNAARMFFAHGLDTSSVVGFQLYDLQGRLQQAAGSHDGGWLDAEHRKRDVLAILRSGQPHLEIELGRVADHHDPAIAATDANDAQAHAGHDQDAMPSGDQIGHADPVGHDLPIVTQTLPPGTIQSTDHISAYFHPIVDQGDVVGVLEIYLDQGAIWGSFTKTFSLLTFGVICVLGIAVAPPLALAWHKAMLKQRADEAMRHLAFHDPLTDLANRTLFRDRLQSASAYAERQGERIAVICIDLDRFKDVNDTLGHAAGDQLLCQVAARLRATLRKSDMLARLGGDEFAVLQLGVVQPGSAANLAERVIDALARPFDVDGHDVVIGSSVGIAIYPDDQTDPDHLLRNADLALYRAKELGRGNYRFFEHDMNRRLQERKALERGLRNALRADQLELHYQPQIAFDSDRIVGVEALVRWRHPERGLIQPLAFIPVAEETGLIIPITEWVLRRACRDARDWDDLTVAVNLSPEVFKHQDPVGLVSQVLQETGFDPRRLELEITETSLLQDTERTLQTLTRLQALGVRVAMDDFGTGYSSLSYLQQFPFDRIKIDRSFISRLTYSADAVAIVGAMINLGHSLGMATTAEGVETPDQAAFLTGKGCDDVQGFYFARPMTADDFTAFRNDKRDGAAPEPAVSQAS